jgi:hypothetical protein
VKRFRVFLVRRSMGNPKILAGATVYQRRGTKEILDYKTTTAFISNKITIKHDTYTT